MIEELDEEVLDGLTEVEKLYTVFHGASQEDVAYAKLFWNSLSLQPPIESRLVSSDIRQRLKVAKTPNTTNAAANQAPWSKRNEEIQQDAYLRQKQEEKQRYMEMAKNRDQIIALLKKQRDERIKAMTLLLESLESLINSASAVGKHCYYMMLPQPSLTVGMGLARCWSCIWFSPDQIPIGKLR
ncbi:cilia- and flagella-associated protein HOATZ isoform X2 [Danio rerio]|uniref:Cilia- and flagella-associated protein HOATZ isoform X2 n=1 Tax=Danio rerio TaxID=7955 RepID=A0AC58JK45_DANRE